MQVTLLRITDDAANFIGECSAICYDSSTNRDANIKRAIACTQKGHLATLRFAHATFHISGISRICSHQFVRSKHLDFLQRSQRYCKELHTEFIEPPMSVSDTNLIRATYEFAYDTYEMLLAKGVKKEDARFVLPEATTTELVVTGNFQAWLDFIKLRADKHAQWEVRNVAREINNILAKETDNLIFTWMPEFS
jgi:thymidylate synthase (FAD)